VPVTVATNGRDTMSIRPAIVAVADPEHTVDGMGAGLGHADHELQAARDHVSVRPEP
jgi:hypothetical protein